MMRVLVVEDDSMVALINMEYLSKIEGVEVLNYVSTKNKTFERLSKEKVDLILLDIFLSGENGFDILKEMRGKGITTDVIMITSANGIEDVKKAFALGVIDYLIKPFDFERFKVAILKAIERVEFFTGTKLTQKSLDEMYSNGFEHQIESLPKGLNSKTLKMIKEEIEQLKEDEFTIKEICQKVEVSNVTIKKYLDYLEKIGIISEDITYGNVGRPQFIYKVKR